jgi:hypothetical protein
MSGNDEFPENVEGCHQPVQETLYFQGPGDPRMASDRDSQTPRYPTDYLSDSSRTQQKRQ